MIDHGYRAEKKMEEDGRVTPSLEEDPGKVFGRGSGHGLHTGDHQNLFASSLNATSLSLPGIISLAESTWR